MCTESHTISALEHIILIGGGAHAITVLDVIQSINLSRARYIVEGFYDDDFIISPLNLRYLGTLEELKQHCIENDVVLKYKFVACIEENMKREQIVSQIASNVLQHPITWATLVHPYSSVSESASVSEGCIICAGAVIGPAAKIGIHTIVNTHASIGNYCNVGAYVHIGSGVNLDNANNIDRLTFISIDKKSLYKGYDGKMECIQDLTGVSRVVTDNTIAESSTVCEKNVRGMANYDKICWLPKKSVSFSRIEHLLADSIEKNHFANGGPCVLKFEDALRNTFKIDQNKAVILACNGSAALHAIIGGLEIFHKKKLKFATQAFTFPTSVQGTLAGSVIVDVDSDAGLDINQIDSAVVDGIIVTNVFGHVVDIKKYTNWAKRFKKFLVFDNAATSYTFYEGRKQSVVYSSFTRSHCTRATQESAQSIFSGFVK